MFRRYDGRHFTNNGTLITKQSGRYKQIGIQSKKFYLCEQKCVKIAQITVTFLPPYSFVF